MRYYLNLRKSAHSLAQYKMSLEYSIEKGYLKFHRSYSNLFLFWVILALIDIFIYNTVPLLLPRGTRLAMLWCWLHLPQQDFHLQDLCSFPSARSICFRNKTSVQAHFILDKTMDCAQQFYYIS